MKISNKSWLYLSSIFAVVLFAPHIASAGSEIIGQVIGNLLLYVLFSPFVALLKVEMIILPIVANFQHFTDLQGVNEGWKAIRDLSNMLFIVILLLMSFATILKIQAYGYKQLLRNLLIMAILVNFSKLIIGVVLDFFQIIMLTFVDAWSAATAGNLSAALGLDSLVTFAAQDNSGGVSGNASVIFDIVMGYLLASIMVVVAVIVLMAFIVTLVMRIVFIWVLVVLSPFAFLCKTFPFTQKYYQDWLAALSAEIVIGPAIAFFLWLSFTIVGSGTIETNFNNASQTAQGQVPGDTTLIDLANEKGGVGATEAGTPGNVLRYIVGIAMLLASLKVSQKIGSAAGNMGKDFGKKFGGGAAALYGRTLLKGRSGSGGLKGALSRSTFGSKTDLVTGQTRMSLVNRGLSKFGGVGSRLASRLEGVEDARVRQKEAYKAKKAENVRDKEVYYGQGISRYDRSLQLKEKIKNNQSLSKDDAIDAKALFSGAMYDEDAMGKLEGATAYVHDQKSAEKLFKGKQLSAANNIDVASLESEGGKAVADQIFKNYDAGQVKKWTENMTKQEQKAWQDAMQAAAVRATSGKDGKKYDFTAMFNTEGQFDKGSNAYKAAMLDDGVYAQAFEQLDSTPDKQRQLATEKGANTSPEDLAKTKKGGEAYEAMVRNLSGQKAANLVASLPQGDQRITVILQEQIATRGTNFLDTPALRNLFDAQQKQALIQGGIAKKISNAIKNAKKISGGTVDEKQVIFENAKGDLRNAHEYLPDFGALTEFVNTLSAREAIQIDSYSLKQISGNLRKDLQDELAEQGIGNSSKKKNK